MLNRFFRIAALWAALVGAVPALASQATVVTPGSPLPMTSLATFLNNAFLSIGSCNSGNSAPANGPGIAAFAGECWINTTTNPWVFSYTADGTHWSEYGTLNTSTFVWTFTNGTSNALLNTNNLSDVSNTYISLQDLGAYANAFTTSGTGTLPTSSGKVTDNTGSGQTFTMPASCTAGQIYLLRNIQTGTLTIQKNGSGGSFFGPNLWNVSSLSMPLLGDFVALICDGTNWAIIGGSADMSGALAIQNNLSDIASANTAINNLFGGSGGIVPANKGGTGNSTLTAHGFVIGEGTGATASVGPCNSNVPVTGQGGSSDPQCGGTIPVPNGGTGQTTALAARSSSGLNIDECTSTGDANYAIASTDRCVYHTALTAARTDTMPAANSVNAGQQLWFEDFDGVVTGSHTITAQRSGSDLINGSTTSIVLNGAFGKSVCTSDGSSHWDCAQVGGGGGSGTVTSVATDTCLTGGTITTSGTLRVTCVPLPQGRLTLQSGHPVMTTTQATQGTLYYDCGQNGGNVVPYWNGTNDEADTVSGCEVSTAMASSGTGVLNAGGVFDVWWEGNTNHKICVSTNGSGGGWASDTGGSNTARGTGYSQLDYTTRPYVTNKNSVSHCYNGSTDYGSITANKLTHLGTIGTDSGSAGKVSWQYGATGAGPTAGVLNVWNRYNQVRVSTEFGDSTSTWPYTTASWREAHNDTTWQVTYTVGDAFDSIIATFGSVGAASTEGTINCAVGIGVDSTGAFSGSPGVASNTGLLSMMATYTAIPGTGQHTIFALEFASGSTCTFGGTFGVAYSQSELNVVLPKM